MIILRVWDILQEFFRNLDNFLLLSIETKSRLRYTGYRRWYYERKGDKDRSYIAVSWL